MGVIKIIPPLNDLSLSYISLEDQTWKNESNLQKNLYYQSVNKDQEKNSLSEFRNQNAISKYLKNEKYQELEKKKNLNFVIRILNQNNYFFCNQTQENFLVVNYHC
ncbi:hypothetical protein H312_02625 [Anncaliia algerae PRA339]|uniref:Uncharacterized protein n=1 Tax=Anncaliia algerae PRA339 TaxID=1288291 RepID=A0A059EZ31_9MICR|nr:hypothetical protein H312_02625 [Anncaliia algerae PRA339]